MTLWGLYDGIGVEIEKVQKNAMNLSVGLSVNQVLAGQAQERATHRTVQIYTVIAATKA